MFGVMQSLNIAICEDPAEAVERGFMYREPEYSPIEIKQVVVVKHGTEGGNPTVDLILEDATGKKFVMMVTGAMLKSIPCGMENENA